MLSLLGSCKPPKEIAIAIAISVVNSVYEENNFNCLILEIGFSSIRLGIDDIPNWTREGMLTDMMKALGDSYQVVLSSGGYFEVKFIGE